MNRHMRSARIGGHTLLEAMFASFLALTCALIFAATVPVANFTRGKAELVSLATSLAQKQMELIKGQGYPNVTATRLHDRGLIDSLTQIDLGTTSFGSSGEMAYLSKTIDGSLKDSAEVVLPSGRSYVMTEQVDLDLRRVTVVVAWKERDTWRDIRITTLVANL